MSAMKYDVASITHTGKVRRNNQDRVLALTGRLDGTGTALLAVADGMGGLACGERASALTVAALDRQGVAPDRATVALRGVRADRDMAMAAARLCRERRSHEEQGGGENSYSFHCHAFFLRSILERAIR